MHEQPVPKGQAAFGMFGLVQPWISGKRGHCRTIRFPRIVTSNFANIPALDSWGEQMATGLRR